MKRTGIAIFGALAVIFFFGFMYFILGGVLDMVALASIPVVLCAEVIILGMLYATIFHSESEETAAAQHSVATLTEPCKPASKQKIITLKLSSPTKMVKS